MTKLAMEDLRYPIGACPLPPTLSPAERVAAIDRIAAAPAALRAAVDGLAQPQLDTPYRPAHRCYRPAHRCQRSRPDDLAPRRGGPRWLPTNYEGSGKGWWYAIIYYLD